MASVHKELNFTLDSTGIDPEVGGKEAREDQEL